MDAAVIGPPSVDVTEVEVDGLACLFSPATGAVVVLNQTASDVWYLCDGTSSLTTIVGRLAQVYSVAADAIALDVEATVRSFRDAGLLPPAPSAP